MRRITFLASALPVLLGTGSLLAADQPLIALTEKPVAITGSVVAAGVAWNCKQSQCEARGESANPDLRMCAELARTVGALKSYKHGNRTLAANQLAQCNDDVREASRDAGARQARRLSVIQHPEPVRSAPIAPGFRQPGPTHVSVPPHRLKQGSFVGHEYVQATRLVHRELAPGAQHVVDVPVTGAGRVLAGVLWMGSAAPLQVRLVRNSSEVTAGDFKSIPPDRGTWSLAVEIKEHASLRLTVANPTAATVHVKISVAVIPLTVTVRRNDR